MRCTATHTVTAADLASGTIINVASTVTDTESGATIRSVPAPDIVTAPTPRLRIVPVTG